MDVGWLSVDPVPSSEALSRAGSETTSHSSRWGPALWDFRSSLRTQDWAGTGPGRACEQPRPQLPWVVAGPVSLALLLHVARSSATCCWAVPERDCPSVLAGRSEGQGGNFRKLPSAWWSETRASENGPP